MDHTFHPDLEQVRKRARETIEDGAVTAAYLAPRAEVVDVLNAVLATEIVCHLRYRNNFYLAQKLGAHQIAEEFAQHASEEQGHAERVAERINQLGGIPNFDPAGLLDRSHAQYVSTRNLTDLVKENLVAERVAVETYSAIVRWLADEDITSRRLMEDLLRAEEEHSDELVDLLERIHRFGN